MRYSNLGPCLDSLEYWKQYPTQRCPQFVSGHLVTIIIAIKIRKMLFSHEWFWTPLNSHKGRDTEADSIGHCYPKTITEIQVVHYCGMFGWWWNFKFVNLKIMLYASLGILAASTPFAAAQELPLSDSLPDNRKVVCSEYFRPWEHLHSRQNETLQTW